MTVVDKMLAERIERALDAAAFGEIGKARGLEIAFAAAYVNAFLEWLHGPIDYESSILIDGFVGFDRGEVDA